MNIILFDDESRSRLLPFTHTRPIADIRCGIFTMRERWEKICGSETGTLAPSYLMDVFPDKAGDDNLLINASVFASEELYTAVSKLKIGEKLVHSNTLIAVRTGRDIPAFAVMDGIFNSYNEIVYPDEIIQLQHVWDIFSLNEAAIKKDFRLITKGRKSAAIPEGVIVTGKENLFLEEGAKIGAGCIINASAGPVYIAKDAELLEGVMVRGPLVVGEHAVVKMGAKIYGATTIGPGCKVGGEISNVVFFANSNKGHDGYLGNAVIGEWCNLGADTNCSNLKNNYDKVKIWDEYNNRSIQTGLTFCGLIMGDHSKCGINTMFNTGTVVGVSCNIYGGGFPEKFIPSFCWGGSDGMTTYSFDKAMDTAKRMMARRNKELTEAEMGVYRHIFENTQSQRDTFTN